MTLIVGLLDRKEHKLYVGGDRCVSYGGDRRSVLKYPKFTTWEAPGDYGDIILGWSGVYKSLQTVQYTFKPPPHIRNKSIDEYVAIDFIDALQECVFSRTLPVQDPEDGMLTANIHLVLFYAGRLFTINREFAIVEAADDYIASGSGMDFALGAFHILDLLDAENVITPEQRILTVLDSAAKHATSVTEPFDFDYIDIPPSCRWYLEEKEEGYLYDESSLDTAENTRV